MNNPPWIVTEELRAFEEALRIVTLLESAQVDDFWMRKLLEMALLELF